MSFWVVEICGQRDRFISPSQDGCHQADSRRERAGLVAVMSFTYLLSEVDLSGTALSGLLPLRDKIWNAAVERAVRDVKGRDVDKVSKRKSVALVKALASREAARDAEEELRRKKTKANILHAYISLVVNGLTRKMSDAILGKLVFLSRINRKFIWTTTAVEEAAAIMNHVYRKLYLCPCTWMHSLPVVVVAAVVETFHQNSEAHDLSWWLSRKRCREVWRRATELCGPNTDEEMVKRVRAAFLMLVIVLRAAKGFPGSTMISSDSFPLDPSSTNGKASTRTDVIFMNEREVRDLIGVLNRAGMTDAGKELESRLQFECAVARLDSAKENKELMQWCSYSAEEEQAIVSCASSVVIRISQVVKSLAQMAGALKRSMDFNELVQKVSIDKKDYAYPFLLSMLLRDSAMCVYKDISLGDCCDSITSRVSDNGDLISLRTGMKRGSKMWKNRIVPIEDGEVEGPMRKKRLIREKEGTSKGKSGSSFENGGGNVVKGKEANEDNSGDKTMTIEKGNDAGPATERGSETRTVEVERVAGGAKAQQEKGGDLEDEGGRKGKDTTDSRVAPVVAQTVAEECNGHAGHAGSKGDERSKASRHGDEKGAGYNGAGEERGKEENSDSGSDSSSEYSSDSEPDRNSS